MYFNANQLRFEGNVAEIALYLSPSQSHKNLAVGRFFFLPFSFFSPLNCVYKDVLRKTQHSYIKSHDYLD